jgi:hypothetical protein
VPGFTNIAGGAIDLNGRVGADISFSGTAGQSAVLPEGDYACAVTTAADCYLKVASTANDVTTANGYLLKSGAMVTLRVRAGDRIGVIGGGAAVLRYHQVG